MVHQIFLSFLLFTLYNLALSAQSNVVIVASSIVINLVLVAYSVITNTSLSQYIIMST